MPEKFSRKREALYNALRATTVHPTAEWLYAALRPEYPDLSLGTVYRNLKKFCAEGKARSVGVINGQEHFDGDTSAHSHFVCDCCGRVLDIFEPLVDTETLERMEAEHGFTITKEDLLFGGVCAECKEKSKNKTANQKNRCNNTICKYWNIKHKIKHAFLSHIKNSINRKSNQKY